MITISAFNDREDALISKALLEAAGVPVTLREENERLYLLVRETDARQAHSVLSGPDPAVRRRSRLRFLASSATGRNRELFVAFLVGGFLFTAGALTFLLLLMPFGFFPHVTLFTLVQLFFFGACANLLIKSVRIRPKIPVYRRRL